MESYSQANLPKDRTDLCDEASTSPWLKSTYDLGSGVNPEIFYRQFLSETQGLIGDKSHYYIASDLGVVRQLPHGQAIVAQVKILMKDNNFYEAWYTEYHFLNEIRNGFNWTKSESKTIRGKWTIVDGEIQFEGLGTGHGFTVIRTMPQMRFTFSRNIISTGVARRVLYASIVKTLDGKDGFPKPPPDFDYDGGFCKTINFCRLPMRESFYLKESYELFEYKKIRIDVFLFDDSYYSIVFKTPMRQGVSMYFFSGIWIKRKEDEIQLGADAHLSFVDGQWHIGAMHDFSPEVGEGFGPGILYDLSHTRKLQLNPISSLALKKPVGCHH